MRKPDLYRLLAAMLLFWASSMPASAAGDPLHFGVFPHLSTRVLLETYQPLADHLSRALKRPVLLETAPDFADFVSRTRAGRYDVLLTPPHLAYLAQAETGYRPLYAYAEPLRGVVVVRKSAPYQGLRDLKGKPVALADPLAIVVMMMEADLSHAGLLQGRDFTRIEARSHNNAALLVVQGKAQAAVVGALAFQQVPARIKQDLRALAYTRPILSPVYMASARIPETEVEALKMALAGFGATASGREFLLHSGLGQLVPVSVAQLQDYQPYAMEAARRLARRRSVP